MPRNGSGTYTPPNGAENAFSGQTIASSTWNAIFTDLSNALTDSLTYDGQKIINGGSGGTGSFSMTFRPLLDVLGIDQGVVISTPSGASQGAINSFRFQDSADASGNGLNSMFGTYIAHAFGGPNVKGGRIALNVALGLTAATNPAGTFSDYVGFTSSCRASVNDGGTGGTPRGGFWAQNLVCETLGTATNLAMVCGTEINVVVRSGTSTFDKNGVRIAQSGEDVVKGSGEDAGIVFVAGTGAVGWTDGILFNVPSSDFTGPLSATGSTLIHAKADVAWTVDKGIDLSGPTITTAAFKSNGFQVNGSGNLTIGGQIKFPATQSVSSDVNTLDDYEEGTWTPTVTFSTPGDLNTVYSNRSAEYQKIGKWVEVWFNLSLSTFTFSTASGQFQINGLPFAATDDFVGTFDFQGVTSFTAGYTQFTLVTAAGFSGLVIEAAGIGKSITSAQVGNFTSGTGIVMRGNIRYISNTG